MISEMFAQKKVNAKQRDHFVINLSIVFKPRRNLINYFV